MGALTIDGEKVRLLASTVAMTPGVKRFRASISCPLYLFESSRNVKLVRSFKGHHMSSCELEFEAKPGAQYQFWAICEYAFEGPPISSSYVLNVTLRNRGVIPLYRATADGFKAVNHIVRAYEGFRWGPRPPGNYFAECKTTPEEMTEFYKEKWKDGILFTTPEVEIEFIEWVKQESLRKRKEAEK